ncbi:MAG TPA: cyclase family protein [Candidatus Binatia bacterium]|nr:cyclase family protein [Candidatus Binatia bacterium]
MALPDWFHELAKRVSNRGRWGADDEIGTLNLITPEATRRGAACVRKGTSFSLALPLCLDGPQTGRIPNRINPLHTMVAINTPFTGDPAHCCLSDDVVVMGLQAATHWDGLAHASYEGRLYNGFPAASVTAEAGATRCGIEKVRPIVTRGILLDVARAKGVGRLDAGYPISPADLDDALRTTGLRVLPGDVLLVRTGQMEHLRAGDRESYRIPSPGLGVATVEWFHDRDVAAVATDTMPFEVWPGEHADALLPVHLLDLVEMGMTQGQNWVLDELAADCAGDGVYEFLLSATPEPFVGAVGSPVTPVATK